MRRWHTLVAIALVILGLFLVCGSREARAQALPDPVMVVRGGALVDGIERALSQYHRAERSIEGWSLEGGAVTAWLLGDEPKKLVAEHQGESFFRRESFWFAGGRVAFAYVEDELYTEESQGTAGREVEIRVEHRIWFDSAGKVARRVRSQVPVRHEWDVRERDPDVAAMLHDVVEYLACARATGEEPRECVAVEPG